LGSGTILDTARFRFLLSQHFGVDPRSVHAFIIGEHGDSEVVAYSGVRVGGMTLEAFTAGRLAPDCGQVAARVRDAGYRIAQGKGYTSFGIATAIVRICEAILRDERAVLPVSTLLRGQYGISDIFMSLPCLIGVDGVAEVLTPAISDDETRDLQASADVLRQAMAEIGLATFRP
jgi:L-lactate dehydrogenase